MIKLGVTGNIASGKTLVEGFLQEEEIPTIDADKLVHKLLASNEKVIKQVSELFTPVDVKDENGAISRAKVGQIVFRDKAKLKQLEEILHPAVKEEIKKFFEENSDKEIVAAVVPLIYEANMADMFDYVLLVTVDKETQLERLMQRNNLNKEEAKLRINAQMAQEEKLDKADFVIDNSDKPEEAKQQLKVLINKIRGLL